MNLPSAKLKCIFLSKKKIHFNSIEKIKKVSKKLSDKIK